MSGNIQISTSESWLNYAPPIPSAIPKSILSIPQFFVSALPVALSFDQSIQGKSRLYSQESHLGVKLGANIVVSVLSSVVRDTLRAFQVSFVTNGYASKSEHSYEEYLPFRGGGTDATFGLALDASRALQEQPLAFQVEKSYLEWFTIPGHKESLNAAIQENVKGESRVDVTGKLADLFGKSGGDRTKRLQNLIGMRDKLKILRYSDIANDANLGIVDDAAAALVGPIEDGAGAARHVHFANDVYGESLQVKDLSPAGIKTLFQKILRLSDDVDPTLDQIEAYAVKLNAEIEEATIDSRFINDFELRASTAAAFKARGDLRALQREQLSTTVKNSERTKEQIKDLDKKIKTYNTNFKEASALNTAFKVVEWGLNILRLGSFLHDQAEYNERLSGLAKAYEPQSKNS